MAETTFQGKRVSRGWRTILTEASLQGVRFHLESGKRTLGEQAKLVREKGVWSPSNPHGAARPNPAAPHIRVGFPNHAIDVRTTDGGEARLERWVQSKGVDWKNTVPGEAWHGEVSLKGFYKLYRYALRKQRERKRRG